MTKNEREKPFQTLQENQYQLVIQFTEVYKTDSRLDYRIANLLNMSPSYRTTFKNSDSEFMKSKKTGKD